MHVHPRLLLLCLWLLSAGATGAPTLVFDTHAGDAWTFEPQIIGRIEGGPCDTITLRSPRGDTRALQIDGRFIASVPLIAGDNPITAQCKRGDEVVAEAKPQTWHVRLPDVPKARVRIVLHPGGISLDTGASEPAAGVAAPLVRYEWSVHEESPAAVMIKGSNVPLSRTSISAKHIELEVPEQDGEYYIRLRAFDALGRNDDSIGVFRVVDGKAQAVDLDSEHPNWVDRAIVYGATPYVFAPQSFEGIQARLDEIAALGANVLWLSPITAAAEDDFGYAVTDHFALRNRFGTAEEFRRLVRSAHERGMRVIVDFVPNHLSDQHAYHLDAAAHEQRSPYFDWFDRNDEGEITQYFDWSHLKNLDYDNREVQSYMIEAFSRFVREFEVDGFRVDASWAVAARAPEFWPRLRAELKRIDPDIFLLAEASARDPYPVENGFDAAYDWTAQLGQWAWHDVFEEGNANLGRLRAALTNEGRGYPPDTLTLRFLNNNDTGERFAARHGEDTARVAATLLFTLPGVPLVYNGDEMAAHFEPYDEGPPLDWDDDHSLVEHYRKLAQIRKQTDALRSRDMELLATNRDADVLTFLRPAETGDVLVLLNFSNRAVSVQGTDAQSKKVVQRFSGSTDLLSGARMKGRGFLLGAKSALILVGQR